MLGLQDPLPLFADVFCPGPGSGGLLVALTWLADARDCTAHHSTAQQRGLPVAVCWNLIESGHSSLPRKDI